MGLLTWFHGSVIHSRRVGVLARHIAPLLPRNASVLDVGCGDGWLSAEVKRLRPDVTVTGVDVLVRSHTHIPVQPFDGTTLPMADRSVDVVMFVDVLHHTADPLVLLREARRVAQAIVIKDHDRHAFLGDATLRFMDRVGNARHGVALPFNYWTKADWQRAFEREGLSVEAWETSLRLYPVPLTWVFDRSLHFIARLATS